MGRARSECRGWVGYGAIVVNGWGVGRLCEWVGCGVSIVNGWGVECVL